MQFVAQPPQAKLSKLVADDEKKEAVTKAEEKELRKLTAQEGKQVLTALSLPTFFTVDVSFCVLACFY